LRNPLERLLCSKNDEDQGDPILRISLVVSSPGRPDQDNPFEGHEIHPGTARLRRTSPIRAY
jgi:hypothetical protein